MLGSTHSHISDLMASKPAKHLHKGRKHTGLFLCQQEHPFHIWLNKTALTVLKIKWCYAMIIVSTEISQWKTKVSLTQIWSKSHLCIICIRPTPQNSDSVSVASITTSDFPSNIYTQHYLWQQFDSSARQHCFSQNTQSACFDSC